MWDNRNYYNGLSVLPYNGGAYKQAPFQDCTEEEYERLLSYLEDIDLTDIIELEDDKSEVVLSFSGDFNAMMAMMIKTPITNFINTLSTNLGKI